MKTQIFSHNSSIFSILNHFRLLYLLVITTIMFGFSEPLQAQQIHELESWVNAKKMQKNTGNSNEGVRVASLAYDLNTMLYFENGIAKTYGQGKPVYIETEVSDIPALYKTNALFEQVELIKIKLNKSITQKSILNVASLSHFKSLKYIVLVCSYNCNPEDLSKRITASPAITMFYSIVIPE